MSTQPFSFKLPLSRFDVGLLPGDARQIGSDRFKDAVIAHFVAQYAGKGENALVTVDDDEITVLTLPKGQAPLDFVMTMLQSGRLKEAVPIWKAWPRRNKAMLTFCTTWGWPTASWGNLTRPSFA